MRPCFRFVSMLLKLRRRRAPQTYSDGGNLASPAGRWLGAAELWQLLAACIDIPCLAL